jgi:hypothetical protein
VEISLLCSGCYNDARIRHTRASVTFDDLSSLRWKCHSCEEWHTGPCLDFGFDAPHYWSGEHQEETASAGPAGLRTFLTENYCAIDDRDFFVRGLIRLPIIGTTMSFCWGVWGSLSRANFQALREKHDDPERIELPPMFSWLSSRIPVYPETLSIKMHVRVRPPGERPHFELELTDHPLAQEYHHGITPERVKEIMANILRETQSGC